MSKTKTLKIAVFAIFSMAIATFATQPAQAEFGLVGGYKYVAVQSELNYDAHVVQLDFLWTIKGGGKGYREGGKRPYQVFGFGLAGGGNSKPDITGPLGIISFQGRSSYFALPLIYEYVFDFGLGISGGATIPIMTIVGEGSLAAGIGIGISDVGLSYYFNNGLTFYARGNIGYAALVGISGDNVGNLGGIMWGAGGGIGYWF